MRGRRPSLLALVTGVFGLVGGCAPQSDSRAEGGPSATSRAAVCTPNAGCATVTIDPADYRGSICITGVGCTDSGRRATFPVSPGSYAVTTGFAAGDAGTEAAGSFLLGDDGSVMPDGQLARTFMPVGDRKSVV